MLISFFNSLRFGKRARAFRRLLPGRGFTIVELLVVALIMVIITGFVLFRQQGFNSSTLLRSLSYSMALTVRQAQVYGVSVRESGSGTGKFAQGYGVYFANQSVLADTTHYLLFSDTIPSTVGNGQYDAGEELPRFTIGNGRGTDYVIKDFCAHNAGTNTDECLLNGTAITSLTIFFRRPNPDACFATNRSPGACALGAAPVYSYAYVQIKSAGSADIRTVKVSNTGQIAVCKLNADPAAC